MQPNLRVRFAKYLQHRHNFIKFGVASVGVPGAVGLLWMFGGHGGVGWWLFLVVLGLAAGWAWAFFMWQVCESDIRRLSSDSTAQKVSEGPRE